MKISIRTFLKYLEDHDDLEKLAENVSLLVRDFLKLKFGTRVTSRHTDTPWPARSLDLFCMDFLFLSVCLSELRRCLPSTLEELKNTVTAYTSSMDREDVISAARDIIVRAKVCKEAQG